MKKIVCGIVLILMSCDSNKTLDDVILKFDDYELTSFRNLSITFRNSDINNVETYMVSKTSSNCRPYIVNYNKKLSKIVTIDKSLASKSLDSITCVMTDLEITEKFMEFAKLDLHSISLEPNRLIVKPLNTSNPTFLMKRKDTVSEIFHNGIKYYRYNSSWYISK